MGTKRKSEVRLVGAAEKVRPATHYVHTDNRPAGDDTYLLDGEPHRYDGRCHPECPNVR